MSLSEPTVDPLAIAAGHPVGVSVSVGATPDGTTLELDVHEDGPHDGEVVLLVAGLGMQRTNWEPGLIVALHEAGYRTVTVDNRDCGRSTVLPGTIEDLPVGDDGWPQPAYSLAAMARDLVAVLSQLDIDRAHVVGISLGGMIAQYLASDHPELVATLTSLMSTTGAGSVGQPHEDVEWVLTTAAPTEFERHLEHTVATARAVGSPDLVDAARVRALATVAFARGLHPQGTTRQLLAARADGDRTPALAGITAPTLVVHGEADPLIDVSGGHATAAAIPNATLHVIEGLGHDLALLDRILPLILDHLGAHPM